MSSKTSEARKRATAKYHAKTFKKINIALRKGEDDDIIRSFELAQAKGMTNREWLRALFKK